MKSPAQKKGPAQKKATARKAPVKSAPVTSPPKPPLSAAEAASRFQRESAEAAAAATVADTEVLTEPEVPAAPEGAVEPEAPVETEAATDAELPTDPELLAEPEVPVEPEAPAETEEPEQPEELPDPLVTSEHDDDVEALVASGAGVTIDDVAADVPALRITGVSKSFGETRAVDAIDLTIPVGGFYGIVGPNGAGKTTTLSMIAGLLRPDRGTIEVAGVDLGRDPARAKRLMGILPDRLRTFDRLTGRQLLHYYGVLRGLRPAVVETRVADLARAFDLSDALGRTVADYSAGMTKKIMLAGAMIHSPRLLVLDEPFEAVDPVSSAVILDILTAYVAHGGTVVLSSHGMDLVERVCSAVAVIVSGQVLAEGTVDQVRGELTLEQRFIELAGGLSDVEGLEWLHTFSG